MREACEQSRAACDTLQDTLATKESTIAALATELQAVNDAKGELEQQMAAAGAAAAARVAELEHGKAALLAELGVAKSAQYEMDAEMKHVRVFVKVVLTCRVRPLLAGWQAPLRYG